MNIIVVGDMDNTGAISASDVESALAHPVTINQDEGFVGRPVTRLFASDSHVIKLKTDHSLTEDKAREWCQRQLDKERGYRIYHPQRCWVVLAREDGCAVANITPRLQTLAMALEPDSGRDNDQRFDLLRQLWDLYFRFLCETGLRQDEGLTNYGLDDAGLWYLDDDIYQPDNMVACAHSLAANMRHLRFLTPTLSFFLGQHLREHVLPLGDTMLESLAHNFADTWLPENRRACASALLRGLAPRHELPGEIIQQGRIAILADIHANLPALEAVLADIETQSIEQILVLGDLVGYGPDPVACATRIRELEALVIRGNHDHAAGGGTTGGGFSRAAQWSLGWTQKQLDESLSQWLGGLPLYLRQDDWYMVHGAPIDATFFNAYVYPRTADQNLDYMSKRHIALCVHGHSHIAGYWMREPGGIVSFSPPQSCKLIRKRNYLACPGSVGQPRDRTEGASYMIVDRNQHSLEWRDVPYDRNELMERMRQHAFPDFLIRMFDPD